ncbi:MAG: NAD(+)/NADH kinase [Acidobacteriota bacterium]
MASNRIRRVGIVAKPHSPHARAILRRLTDWLRRKRIPFHCDPGAASALRGRKRADSRQAIYRKVDLLVVLGGDGTLLSVARDIAPTKVPVLGVNLGSLGFLTEVTLGEMLETLALVFSGKYEISRRMMLQARLFRAGRQLSDHCLLNDIVLNKSALARIIEIEVAIDGRYVTSYRADGLIISTPTGSTAYSLSAGGPIIHPNMRAFCVTPICPHTLTNRPIVVPSQVTIDLSIRKESDEDVFLTLDGQVGVSMRTGDRVQVRRSRHSIHLVQISGKPYFDVLRNKLKWGGK